MAAAIEARELYRFYHIGDEETLALRGVSLTVDAGEMVAVVGPSGSGKSTLIACLAGLDEPTSGTAGWPALGEKGMLRPSKVSFVFQSQSLLAPLTVLENIEVPLLLAGMGDDEARRDATAMLTALDLTALADKLPEEISGGQAQRVAVARSLVTKPDLILADEPTGQLDHATASGLLDLVERHLQGTSAAFVVATHDPFVANRMKTLWKMDHGVLR
jgi:ABC-type lipoprotein export system ATPase subunit